MSSRLCPGDFVFALCEISNGISLSRSVTLTLGNSSKGTIVFSTKRTIGMGRGLLSVMVFASPNHLSVYVCATCFSLLMQVSIK